MNAEESSPGNKLWLKPYKIAIGAIHISIDAVKNFLTTSAIDNPEEKYIIPNNKVSSHLIMKIDFGNRLLQIRK